ncbi:MAG: nitric oxide reductase, partial [Alphaproteobacteria bacterium]|nr:nitric oxide reductase [Alphaproteobacteria bacterium]
RYAAADNYRFSEWPGKIAFWLYNAGVVLWIVLNFFPVGWPQLDAVFAHGLAYARSNTFYDTTLFWQWMRLPGDVLFALGALLMAWDFITKLGPFLPPFAEELQPRAETVESLPPQLDP